jgi:hypothetical protein
MGSLIQAASFNGLDPECYLQNGKPHITDRPINRIEFVVGPLGRIH